MQRADETPNDPKVKEFEDRLSIFESDQSLVSKEALDCLSKEIEEYASSAKQDGIKKFGAIAFTMGMELVASRIDSTLKPLKNRLNALRETAAILQPITAKPPALPSAALLKPSADASLEGTANPERSNFIRNLTLAGGLAIFGYFAARYTPPEWVEYLSGGNKPQN